MDAETRCARCHTSVRLDWDAVLCGCGNALCEGCGCPDGVDPCGADCRAVFDGMPGVGRHG